MYNFESVHVDISPFYTACSRQDCCAFSPPRSAVQKDLRRKEGAIIVQPPNNSTQSMSV